MASRAAKLALAIAIQKATGLVRKQRSEAAGIGSREAQLKTELEVSK